MVPKHSRVRSSFRVVLTFGKTVLSEREISAIDVERLLEVLDGS